MTRVTSWTPPRACRRTGAAFPPLSSGTECSHIPGSLMICLNCSNTSISVGNLLWDHLAGERIDFERYLHPCPRQVQQLSCRTLRVNPGVAISRNPCTMGWRTIMPKALGITAKATRPRVAGWLCSIDGMTTYTLLTCFTAITHSPIY